MTWVLGQIPWIIPLKPSLGCVRLLDSLEVVNKIRPAALTMCRAGLCWRRHEGGLFYGSCAP